MKITAIEPILVRLPFEHGAPKPKRHNFGVWETQDILFVKVETDAGFTGWGEAFAIGGASLTQLALRDAIAPLAVGRNIDDPLALGEELRKRLYTIARGGPVAFALSGFDMALWDIAGKQAGRSVSALLGNAPKKSLPAYASLHRLEDPETVARICRTAAERGYRQIKLHEHSVEAVAAARKAIGPDVALMVDTNCFWTSVETATAACRSFAPYDVTWVEEPLYPADDYPSHAELRQAGGLPISAGENLGDFNDVRWMLAAGAVDIVQPSVAKLGGITEVWKALTYARVRQVRAVPHSPFVGPALIATIHMIAALPEDVPCEHRYCDLGASALGDCVLAKDGRLQVPDGPGLGFEVDMDVVEKYRAG
jgi:L-alanine-DL-glutamate epimerase-like enolase superfamily enzyme